MLPILAFLKNLLWSRHWQKIIKFLQTVRSRLKMSLLVGILHIHTRACMVALSYWQEEGKSGFCYPGVLEKEKPWVQLCYLCWMLSPTISFNLKITQCSLTRGKCSYVSSKQRTRGESSLPCDYSVLLSTPTPVVPEQKLVVHGFQVYHLHRKNILEHWSSTTTNIKF